MGRLSAAIWMAIALFGLLSVLPSINPDPESTQVLRTGALFATVAGIASFFIPWSKLHRNVFQGSLALMSIVIGALAYGAGPAHGDLTLLFTFVVVFAAYFFDWRAVIVQLCLIAGILVSRLALFGFDRIEGAELVRLAILLPALLIIAWLVSFLRRHVQEQAARLQQVGNLLGDVELEPEQAKPQPAPPAGLSSVGGSPA